MRLCPKCACEPELKVSFLGNRLNKLKTYAVVCPKCGQATGYYYNELGARLAWNEMCEKEDGMK